MIKEKIGFVIRLIIYLLFVFVVVRSIGSAKQTTYEASRLTTFDAATSTEIGGQRPTNYMVSDIASFDGAYNYHIGTPYRFELGDKRFALVEIFGVFLVAASLIGVLAHALLRVVARMLRMKKEPVALKPAGREYKYRKMIRLGHWVDAFCVITLLITGFSMHYFGASNALGIIHNKVGMLLLLVYVLFLGHELVLVDIKQFLPTGKELKEMALRQIKYYVYDIFKGRPPLHTAKGQRLLPMQKLAYFGLMFGMMAVVVLTGFMLVDPRQASFLVSLIGGMENMKWVFLLHLLSAFCILHSVIIHVYMITTGDKASQHLLTMITGYHREYERE